jgi:hypothetical protein
MTKRTLTVLVSILFVLCVAPILSASTAQQQSCPEPCGKPTWQDFNGFSLKVITAGESGYAAYQGSFDEESHDIQVDIETSESGSIKKGKILMIGGRIMAMQGSIAKPGYEIDALDGAILQLQLVMKLLGRALPNGPGTIAVSRKVDHEDAKAGVQIATPSAEGMIEAPWRVVGELKRASDDVVEYDLTLTFPSKQNQETGTISLSGKLFRTNNANIDDQLSLASWNVFGVGPQSRKQDGATIIDYNAAPETTRYKTVADVRKKLAADDNPGEPDTTKDFTGFWKTDCENAFGLQIKHHGTGGKYSIVFCGPGGCGSPEEGRKTFITKDPQFQVTSEDELKEQTSDGWKTYRRCTRDTNPVLQYKMKK